VLITRSDVDRAERFLEGRGAWAVPVGRMIPVVRAFTSIVAGLIEMPLARFAVLSLIGTVVYVSAFSAIGYAVGSAWNTVAHDVSILGYVIVVLVVAAIAGFIIIRLRAFRREAAASTAVGPAGDAPPDRGAGPRHGTGPRHRINPGRGPDQPGGTSRDANGRTGADRG
jgi:SNARE associated Golgi protein